VDHQAAADPPVETDKDGPASPLHNTLLPHGRIGLGAFVGTLSPFFEVTE
jgi:hypothetical protein